MPRLRLPRDRRSGGWRDIAGRALARSCRRLPEKRCAEARQPTLPSCPPIFSPTARWQRDPLDGTCSLQVRDRPVPPSDDFANEAQSSELLPGPGSSGQYDRGSLSIGRRGGTLKAACRRCGWCRWSIRPDRPNPKHGCGGWPGWKQLFVRRRISYNPVSDRFESRGESGWRTRDVDRCERSMRRRIGCG